MQIIEWYKSRFRPFKWWLAEIINRSNLPSFIFRKYRRNEVAESIIQARKDGFGYCKYMLKDIARRAPKKK